MQFKSLLKPKILTEVLLTIILIIFLVFPVAIPEYISKVVESSLGMIVLLSVTVLLFLYANMFLAIFFIFVAYELIRRCSIISGKTNYIQYTPTQDKRDEYIKSMNAPKIITLEEDMVSKMAPIEKNVYIDSTFKPVSDGVHNALSIN